MGFLHGLRAVAAGAVCKQLRCQAGPGGAAWELLQLRGCSVAATALAASCSQQKPAESRTRPQNLPSPHVPTCQPAQRAATVPTCQPAQRTATVPTAQRSSSMSDTGTTAQQLPAHYGDGKRGAGRAVAVGLSGGVDSAVAALLLLRQGYQVTAIFMRNWDEAEETGNQNCSVERDFQDAQRVCQHLGVPLVEADFVAQYWTQVFQDFLAQCGRGLSPNPDLACNRHIKFRALLDFAAGLGLAQVATGHYARLRTSPQDGAVQLLRGADSEKDQSYFLAEVPGAALGQALFPVGELRKPQVRAIAQEAGLPVAHKRSTAGICFIGRRNFGEFMGQYVAPVAGRFVDVEGGRDMGPCPNLLALTHGQRAGIGGRPDRVYVAGKDMVEKVVYVAEGRGHPALHHTTALLRQPHWVAGHAPAQLTQEGGLHCAYKARYNQPMDYCTVQPASSADVAPSIYCRVGHDDLSAERGSCRADFSAPAESITPQQAFVMYDGEVCLGSAPIAYPGPSLFELGERLEPEVEQRAA